MGRVGGLGGFLWVLLFDLVSVLGFLSPQKRFLLLSR